MARQRKLMMKLRNNFFFIIALLSISNFSIAQIDQSKGSFEDKFRQLDEAFPTPNLNRPATGEPGPSYWQQKADYKIKIKLDEVSRSNPKNLMQDLLNRNKKITSHN